MPRNPASMSPDKPGSRLRFDDRLRREHADARQCLAAADEMLMWNAGEREPQQEIVAAPRVDDDVVGRRRERDVPGGKSFFDLGKLLGMERRGKERRRARMREQIAADRRPRWRRSRRRLPRPARSASAGRSTASAAARRACIG